MQNNNQIKDQSGNSYNHLLGDVWVMKRIRIIICNLFHKKKYWKIYAYSKHTDWYRCEKCKTEFAKWNNI